MTAFTAPTRRELLALLAAAPLMGGAAPPVVRFKLEGERITVPVRVGDRALTFMIDSGSAMSGITQSLADELKLARVGVARLRGMNSVDAVPAYLAPRVNIGGALDRQDMTLVGFPRIAADGVSGLIGADLLTAFDSTLDFGTRDWWLTPRGDVVIVDMSRLDSGVVADIHRGPRLLVNVTIDGQPCRLSVDTGAPRSILFGRSAQRLGLWNDQRPYATIVTPDIFGQSLGMSRLVRVDRMDFGPFDLRSPEIALQDPTARGVENLDGLLGLDLIQHINWLIDVKGSALWAKRNHGYLPPRP